MVIRITYCSCRGFSAYLSEALLQVVRKEAVEHRVGTRVGIGQDDGEEVNAGGDAGLWDDDDQIDNVDDEERQPAEHKHHHDHHHHPRHLALGASTFGESRPRPRGLHLQGKYHSGEEGVDDERDHEPGILSTLPTLTTMSR